MFNRFFDVGSGRLYANSGEDKAGGNWSGLDGSDIAGLSCVDLTKIQPL